MEPWLHPPYCAKSEEPFSALPGMIRMRRAEQQGEDAVDACHDGNGNGRMDGITFRPAQRRVEVTFTEEQYAALEGWRSANRVGDRSEAVRELVRLGLLAEIARVYRLVVGVADADEGADGGFETRS